MVKEKLFLALSGNSKYWKLDKKILFIEDFYVPYFEEDIIKKIDYVVCERNYSTDIYWGFFDDAKKLYRSFLPILSNVMNEIHCVKMPIDFWNKLLELWMVDFFLNIHIKYSHIKDVMKEYNDVDIYTVVMDEKDFIVLKDWDEYNKVSEEHEYNLQLYSRIVNYFAKDFKLIEKKQKLVSRVEKYNEVKEKKSLKDKFVKLFKENSPLMIGKIISNKLFNKLLYKYYDYKNRYNVKMVYFQTNFDIAMDTFIATKGIVRSVETPHNDLFENCIYDNKIRTKIRDKLLENINNGDSFKNLLVDILCDEMPYVFLEKFKETRALYTKIFSEFPLLESIISYTGWYSEHILCYGAIEQQIFKNVKLIGIQHGGDYGLLKNASCYEDCILDEFYTWKLGGFYKNIRYTPSFPYKMKGYRQLGANNKLKNILYVGTAIHSYKYSFYTIGIEPLKYINNQILFFKSIDKKILSNIRVRNYYKNYGWNIDNRLKNIMSELNFDEEIDCSEKLINRDFKDSLINCKIYVTDHLSTTYLEAFFVDKPIVIILRRGEYEFYEEEQQYIDLLEQVGIIHYNSETAAQLVNSIYDDVEKWWNDPVRRDVVERFRHRYLVMNNVQDPDKWWIDELKKYAD